MSKRIPLGVDRTPSLVADVVAMLAENDLHRRPDADDCSLWEFNSAAHAAHVTVPAAQPWPPCMHFPVIRPPQGTTTRRGGQERYTDEFNKAFPGVTDVVRQISNVYVAGGAANWPLVSDFDPGCKPKDVDIFIVGIDPGDPRALWAKVGEVCDAVRRTHGEWKGVMTPGVLTLQLTEGPIIQIILRAFATVSALLHGFDLPSCAIAFDGEVAYMTHAAVWAYVYMLNVVNPAYRSTTYEYRLCKYLRRGYGLGFLGMSPAALPAQGRLDLPHMVIAVWETRDAVAFGSAFVQYEETSDYSVGGTITAITDTMRDLYNIRQIAIGKKWYAARLAPDDFQTPGEFVPPTLDNILPRNALDAALDHAAKKAVGPDVLVSGKRLRRVFQMSDHEVHKFRRAMAAFAPGNAADAAATSLLAPFRAALVAAYEAAPRGEIPWWILIDPSRQYTVSLNPRMEDAAAWYGDAAAASSG